MIRFELHFSICFIIIKLSMFQYLSFEPGIPMNHQKTLQWLHNHQIVLEESFTSRLKTYAVRYQKSCSIPDLNTVYKMLGISKQTVSWWKNHPDCYGERSSSKRQVISRSVKLFHMTDKEAEQLANSAGLSLSSSQNFSALFDTLLSHYDSSYKELLEKANISERMFQFIHKEQHLTK